MIDGEFNPRTQRTPARFLVSQTENRNTVLTNLSMIDSHFQIRNRFSRCVGWKKVLGAKIGELAD